MKRKKRYRYREEELNRDQFANTTSYIKISYRSILFVRSQLIDERNSEGKRAHAAYKQIDFLVDGRIDPKWLAIMSKETKGTSVMSPWLGYALYIDSAKLLQYDDT